MAIISSVNLLDLTQSSPRRFHGSIWLPEFLSSVGVVLDPAEWYALTHWSQSTPIPAWTMF